MLRQIQSPNKQKNPKKNVGNIKIYDDKPVEKTFQRQLQRFAGQQKERKKEEAHKMQVKIYIFYAMSLSELCVHVCAHTHMSSGFYMASIGCPWRLELQEQGEARVRARAVDDMRAARSVAFNIRTALSLLFPFPSVIFEKLIYGQ